MYDKRAAPGAGGKPGSSSRCTAARDDPNDWAGYQLRGSPKTNAGTGAGSCPIGSRQPATRLLARWGGYIGHRRTANLIEAVRNKQFHRPLQLLTDVPQDPAPTRGIFVQLLHDNSASWTLLLPSLVGATGHLMHELRGLDLFELRLPLRLRVGKGCEFNRQPRGNRLLRINFGFP